MNPASPVDRPQPRGAGAVRATYVVFIASGFVLASWAARIPQYKAQLQLGTSALGLLLLAAAAGSVIALPMSGIVVARLGSRGAVAAMSVVLAAGLVAVAIGFHAGTAVVAVGLFAMGFGNGIWDVAMNIQGAAAERNAGRQIMSRFHAGYSIGTVAGALLGTAVVALHVAPTWHLLVVAGVTAALVPATTRGFLPDAAPGATTSATAQADDAPDAPRRSARSASAAAWREPRTLAIGVFVLAMAFTEGAGNDWIGVSIVDDYGRAPALGTLGFAVFLAAMTAGRWFGPVVLDRWGRVSTVRTLCALALGGVLVFAFGSVYPLALLGVALWGVGASLGFPVGMSAGADDPQLAAPRVATIASIGYCAFLAGPPLIGLLGEQVSVQRALLVLAGLLVVAVGVSASVRPLPVVSSPSQEVTQR